MRNRSVVAEAREINLAVELVRLGARLQVLEDKTNLSRERLLRLYKEVKGASPPKGMLPFSADWFLSWQANIHASLFLGVHRFLVEHAEVSGVDALTRAYRLYLEHASLCGLEPVLSITRAWILLNFLKARVLTTVPCRECDARFVAHAMDLHGHYVCGLCHVPSRAGRTRKDPAGAPAGTRALPQPPASGHAALAEAWTARAHS